MPKRGVKCGATSHEILNLENKLISDNLEVAGRRFEWGRRTYLMGILNATPDSFAGDSLGDDVGRAVAQARAFVAAGADILDIGGESTNPYHSAPVAIEEEIRRVLPLIRAIAGELDVPLSIDTRKTQVAAAALEAGAHFINDITGLADLAMRELAARTGAPVIIMHSRGTPQTMMTMTDYGGQLIPELLKFFRERVALVLAAGVQPANIILDPGIGFAKDGAQNIEILQRLAELRNELSYPLLLGVSRKGFVGRLVAGGLDHAPVSPQQRIFGTAAAITMAIAGGADIVRVHDVAAMADVIKVADAIVRPLT